MPEESFLLLFFLPFRYKDLIAGGGVAILGPWKSKYEIQSWHTKDSGIERAWDPDGIVKQLSQPQQLSTSRVLGMWKKNELLFV